MSEISPAAVPVPLPEIKPKVAEAAAASNLGPLREACVEGNPFTKGLLWIVAAAACIGLLTLFSWLGVTYDVGWLRVFVCLLGIGALFSIFFAVQTLVRGFRATYWYENGLVYLKNGRVQVMPWSQVDEMLLWKAGGKSSMKGLMLSYIVVGFDGQKFSVAANGERDPGDSFGGRLCGQVAQLGRPVKDSGPYVGRMRP
jgi:hypothetical protein